MQDSFWSIFHTLPPLGGAVIGWFWSYLHVSQEMAITDIRDYTLYNNHMQGDGTWRQG